MKKYILSIAFLALGLISSNAANVVLARGTGAGLNVLSSAGTPLSSFTIFVGTFSSAPASVTSDNWASVSSSFIEFGNATGTTPVGATIARTEFTGGQAASNFNNRQIYLIIANASTLAAATEAGVYTKSAVRTDWVFPADTPGALANIGASVISAAAVSAIGGTIVDNASGIDSFRLFEAVPIPEPSTSLFGLATLGLMIARRRR